MELAVAGVVLPCGVDPPDPQPDTQGNGLSRSSVFRRDPGLGSDRRCPRAGTGGQFLHRRQRFAADTNLYRQPDALLRWHTHDHEDGRAIGLLPHYPCVAVVFRRWRMVGAGAALRARDAGRSWPGDGGRFFSPVSAGSEALGPTFDLCDGGAGHVGHGHAVAVRFGSRSLGRADSTVGMGVRHTDAGA